MHDRGHRHRHGVHKKLVEGAGGILTGIALVLLLRGLLRRNQQPSS